MCHGSHLARSIGKGPYPITAMTHIAIHKKLDGKVVERLEPINDEQYPKGWIPMKIGGMARQSHLHRQRSFVRCCR
jgi:hypothetical protein